MVEPKIIDVDYGIASNYGDFIEINKKLRKYPILRDKIIEHEKRHSSGGYTKKDLKNDFQSKDSYFFESLKFCLTNKEGFINFFPLMYSYNMKDWTYNTSAIFPVLFFGMIFTLFFKFAVQLSYIYSIIGWIGFMILINGIFLLITHAYVKTTIFTKENK